MRNSTITLNEYLQQTQDKGGKFIIPSYQRGYVWGQEKEGQKSNAVEVLLDSLINGFQQDKEIFLQGITVCETADGITLVDGQQRTTFFYLLLKYLGYEGQFEIDYAVRSKSDQELKRINIPDIISHELDIDEPYQDIYFFRKSIRIIDRKLQKIDKPTFMRFILNKVKFLYIPIPQDKTTIVFTMMNGNKAKMLNEELIKSELLRSASLNAGDGLISEAENTIIRSRLAREWDAWLHWWNEKEHQEFFKIETQLGWLLPLISQSDKVTFDDFKRKIFKESTVKSAKAVFKRMRLLQKSIEDAYDDPKTYNYIGGILHFRESLAERFTFLQWYFNYAKDNDKQATFEELKRYFDWAMLGLSHAKIVNKKIEDYQRERDRYRTELEDDLLFINYYETAARWLLRLNILQDSRQESGNGRKFDFTIWQQRSLEHIYPKSKVGHTQDGITYNWKDEVIQDTKKISLWREDIKFTPNDSMEEYHASEHSIGNLVLLYKDDNSRFNADDFQDKKKIFFDNVGDSMFKSRHLIHTISVFAASDWNGEIIARHKKEEIDNFDKDFKDYE